MTESYCKFCGEPIALNNNVWCHIQSHPRHPAVPREMSIADTLLHPHNAAKIMQGESADDILDMSGIASPESAIFDAATLPPAKSVCKHCHKIILAYAPEYKWQHEFTSDHAAEQATYESHRQKPVEQDGGPTVYERNVPYVRTVSLTKVHFMNFNPDEVLIEDMAYHLAGIQRFSGGCRPRLSVAEHLINCMIMIAHHRKMPNDPKFLKMVQLATLLHDSEEYIFGDLASPIKEQCPDFRKLALDFRYGILQKYGVYEWYVHNERMIKDVDLKMYRTENHFLRNYPQEDIYDLFRFRNYTPEQAEKAFLEAFHSCRT